MSAPVTYPKPAAEDIINSSASGRAVIKGTPAEGRTALELGTTALLNVPIAETSVTPSTAVSVTTKERIGSVGYLDVGSTNAALISASWSAYNTKFTLALSPADSGMGGNGVKIYIGMSGDRVTYFTGVGGDQALAACTGTITLYRPTPTFPNSVTQSALTVYSLTGSFLIGTGSDQLDYAGVLTADAYIRPSSEPMSAIWIGLTNAGADTGYPFGIGKKDNSCHKWQSDGHTHKVYSNGGFAVWDSAYIDYTQPFLIHGWVSRGAYTDAGTWLAANPNSITALNLTLRYQQIADGVYHLSGVDNTTPASFASPIRTQTLATSQNDFSAGLGMTHEWTGAGGGSTVTGMVAGQLGEIREIWILSNAVTFSHQSASSSAANRFTCNTGANITAAAGSVVKAVYKNSTVGWRVAQIA